MLSDSLAAVVRPQIEGHLALLAGRRRDGKPVYEIVPAQSMPDGHWRLLGTPALAEGCAEGDVLAVTDDGEFSVRERGGNVSVISYAESGRGLEPHDVEALRHLLGPLQARVETPEDRRWVVATIPIAAGLPAIEAALARWSARTSQAWSYGNVYDEHDQPLNWW